MYRALMQRKKQLLDSNGPLQNFMESKIRLVNRNTRVYVKLLDTAGNLSLMKNGLKRSMHFDQLALGPMLVWKSKGIDTWRLIRKEHESIENNSIPYFWTYFSNSKIYHNQDQVRDLMINNSAFENVKSNIRSLSSRDLEKQKELIQRSLFKFAKRWEKHFSKT